MSSLRVKVLYFTISGLKYAGLPQILLFLLSYLNNLLRPLKMQSKSVILGNPYVIEYLHD